MVVAEEGEEGSGEGDNRMDVGERRRGEEEA